MDFLYSSREGRGGTTGALTEAAVSDVSGMSKAGETEMGGMLEVAVAVGGAGGVDTAGAMEVAGGVDAAGATEVAEWREEAGAVVEAELGVVGFKLCREAMICNETMTGQDYIHSAESRDDQTSVYQCLPPSLLPFSALHLVPSLL